jgi:hypothetical protein
LCPTSVSRDILILYIESASFKKRRNDAVCILKLHCCIGWRGAGFPREAAKNDHQDLEESVATKLKININTDPALSLLPEKQRLIAEHLLVLDSHNLWFLPFEKKISILQAHLLQKMFRLLVVFRAVLFSLSPFKVLYLLPLFCHCMLT